MKKRNIVFYFSDRQRRDTVGAYGQKPGVTPNLDALTEKGTLFANAFTCQPVCGPARACLQSGKYATETVCFRNDIALPRNIRTLAKVLIREMVKAGETAPVILSNREIPPHMREGPA